MMTRSNALRRLLCAVCAAAAAGDASAQSDFSEVELPEVIRVLVAYNAGGSSDTLARITLPAWESAVEALSGQETSAVVVNLPGAGGEIGWTSLANAQPDGSTIGVINLPAVPLVEAARDAQFEPWLERFVPLGVNVIDPNVLRLSSRSDYGSLQEAIDAAKENPGSVIVGADGPLSDDHVAMYALERATGAKFTFIPFAGGAPANQAFMSGEVDLAIGNAFDHVQTADSAAEAAVLRDERYDLLPDVPTVKEALGVEMGEFGSTRGWAAPAGSPEDLVALYREAFAQAFADEAYQAEARERNVTIVPPKIGEAFGELMAQEQRNAEELLPLFVEGGFISQ